MSISLYESHDDPNLIQGDRVQYEQSEAADLPRVFRDKVSNLNFLEFTFCFLRAVRRIYNNVFPRHQAGKSGEERNGDHAGLEPPAHSLPSPPLLQLLCLHPPHHPSGGDLETEAWKILPKLPIYQIGAEVEEDNAVVDNIENE